MQIFLVTSCSILICLIVIYCQAEIAQLEKQFLLKVETHEKALMYPSPAQIWTYTGEHPMQSYCYGVSPEYLASMPAVVMPHPHMYPGVVPDVMGPSQEMYFNMVPGPMGIPPIMPVPMAVPPCIVPIPPPEPKESMRNFDVPEMKQLPEAKMFYEPVIENLPFLPAPVVKDSQSHASSVNTGYIPEDTRNVIPDPFAINPARFIQAAGQVRPPPPPPSVAESREPSKNRSSSGNQSLSSVNTTATTASSSDQSSPTESSSSDQGSATQKQRQNSLLDTSRSSRGKEADSPAKEFSRSSPPRIEGTMLPKPAAEEKESRRDAQKRQQQQQVNNKKSITSNNNNTSSSNSNGSGKNDREASDLLMNFFNAAASSDRDSTGVETNSDNSSNSTTAEEGEGKSTSELSNNSGNSGSSEEKSDSSNNGGNSCSDADTSSQDEDSSSRRDKSDKGSTGASSGSSQMEIHRPRGHGHMGRNKQSSSGNAMVSQSVPTPMTTSRTPHNQNRRYHHHHIPAFMQQQPQPFLQPMPAEYHHPHFMPGEAMAPSLPAPYGVPAPFVPQGGLSAAHLMSINGHPGNAMRKPANVHHRSRNTYNAEPVLPTMVGPGPPGNPGMEPSGGHVVDTPSGPVFVWREVNNMGVLVENVMPYAFMMAPYRVTKDRTVDAIQMHEEQQRQSNQFHRSRVAERAERRSAAESGPSKRMRTEGSSSVRHHNEEPVNSPS